MKTPISIRQQALSTFETLGIRRELVGKPYINWLRCSTYGQADTSPDGQKEVNDAYCAFQGMPWAGYDMFAEGVSGSQTFNREDIEDILELKRTRNDFEVVVVFELGRATRGGISHGNEVEKQLKMAGIKLISSTELIPEGPIGELIKAVKHFSNQQQAMSISKSVARGLAQSLAKATRPAAGRTNYGLDRIYYGPNATPRVLTRWEGLVQLRLDPITKNEVGRAVRQPSHKPRKKGEPRQRRERKSRFVGYRKQDDETSMFVAGAQHAHEVVVDIWRMHYCQNIGAHRIIQKLRQKGVAAPCGGDWNLTSVHNILWNPIYMGVEVRHRSTKALYNKLGPDGPVPVEVDQDELQRQGRVAVPQTERPRDEWVLVDKPQLKDFLPPEVRQAALAHITALYDTDAVVAKQAKRQKRKNKSDDNPYVLSHLLHSKQTKNPMRGDSNRRKVMRGSEEVTELRRYYFDYSTASKAISGLHARRIRAEPLEEAVIPAVLESLFDRRWVEDRVRSHIETMAVGVRNVVQERQVLFDEKADITDRLKRVHRTSKHLNDEDLDALVADDNARLSAIRRELADLENVGDHRPPTADEAVAAVMARLATVPTDWRALPNAELKGLLKAVVGDLEIDLATREVTLSINLPVAATVPLTIADGDGRGRATFQSLWSSLLDSTRDNSLKIAEIGCIHDAKQKCYTCRRLKNAA